MRYRFGCGGGDAIGISISSPQPGRLLLPARTGKGVFMPSDKSIPQGQQRPNVATRHATIPLDDYELALAAEEAPYMSAVPGRAIVDRRLTAHDYRIFALMCGYSNKITRICWPKQETLARLLGTNVQVISKCVAKLMKLGYVEVAKTGFPARNVYRIVWADPQEKPLAECLPATELSPQTSQSCLPRQVRVVSPDKRNNRLLEQTIRTSSSEVTVNQTSLAHSAENAAPAPASVAASPERRTRERLNVSALKRDPLVIALIACFGVEPATPHEWDSWRIAVNDLHAAGATSRDIPRAIQAYQALHPKGRITPMALARNWSQIREGKSHDLAQLEISRRSTQAVRDTDAERRAAEEERRAAERAEVDRLMAEWGYGPRQGESPRG